jgi:hypothetical protein
LFLYAGFASYSELRLIRLLRAPISAEEPLEYDGYLFHSPTEKKIYEDVKRASSILGLIFLKNGKPYSSFLRRLAFLGLDSILRGIPKQIVRFPCK